MASKLPRVVPIHVRSGLVHDLGTQSLTLSLSPTHPVAPPPEFLRPRLKPPPPHFLSPPLPKAHRVRPDFRPTESNPFNFKPDFFRLNANPLRNFGARTSGFVKNAIVLILSMGFPHLEFQFWLLAILLLGCYEERPKLWFQFFVLFTCNQCNDFVVLSCWCSNSFQSYPVPSSLMQNLLL
ncbi:hypothetical protein TIFTF001_039071 [Ficus carica]|uniref:Uncharacterized protein n=1 Tax=Ficus carica TaxID=3494 RepID=A0AA88E8H7_FICCA|nr:hypothetical protein TIFTF001_039071 [Ficus carica]